MDFEFEICVKMLFECGNYYDSVGLCDLVWFDFI